MDFKKPGHAYENPERAADSATDEPVAPQTQPMVVKKGRSLGQKIMTAFLLLLLVSITGYAVYVFMSEQQVRKELTDAKSQLNELQTGKDSVEAKAKSFDELQKSNADMSDNAQRIRVTNAASDYFCLVKDFGCDKVSAEITKFQATKITDDTTSNQEGFAIVTATPTSNQTAVKFYLKSRDGFDWVVIFDGQNVPSADVAKKFTIPASFL